MKDDQNPTAEAIDQVETEMVRIESVEDLEREVDCGCDGVLCRAADLAADDLPDWAPAIGERVRRDVFIETRRNKTKGSEVENRTAVIINTADEDRHGTIIDPSGARLDNYRRNPAVLINHDHDLLAAVSSITVQGDRIVANLDDDSWDHDDPLVERWFRKLKKGILKAASIGAIVHDYVVELIDPEGDAEDWDNRRIRITDWELIEWSFVSVGSNASALVTQRMIDRQAKVAPGAFLADALPTAPREINPVEDRPVASEPEPDPDPVAEPEAVAKTIADVSAPAPRKAGPVEYAALARIVASEVRSELQRLTGKR